MLLDTHVLLWVLEGSARLGSAARTRLLEAGVVHCSAISLAEIRIKQMLGRLEVPPDLPDRIAAAGLRSAPYPGTAADALPEWPTLVRHDPFDRMLLTHAVALGTVLLTADQVLLSTDGAPVVDARV